MLAIPHINMLMLKILVPKKNLETPALLLGALKKKKGGGVPIYTETFKRMELTSAEVGMDERFYHFSQVLKKVDITSKEQRVGPIYKKRTNQKTNSSTVLRKSIHSSINSPKR